MRCQRAGLTAKGLLLVCMPGDASVIGTFSGYRYVVDTCVGISISINSGIWKIEGKVQAIYVYGLSDF